MLKRIALTGTESTGKTTLAQQLAQHFNTVWVPEYARQYIDNLDRPYVAEDLLQIAKGQIDLESQCAKQANQFLISDTELTVIKIWCEHAYGFCHPWVFKKILTHQYDLYLLLKPDIPWQPDPQREHPHLRQHLFQCYLKELQERKVNFVIISGNYEQRLQQAIKAIEQIKI